MPRHPRTPRTSIISPSMVKAGEAAQAVLKELAASKGIDFKGAGFPHAVAIKMVRFIEQENPEIDAKALTQQIKAALIKLAEGHSLSAGFLTCCVKALELNEVEAKRLSGAVEKIHSAPVEAVFGTSARKRSLWEEILTKEKDKSPRR